MLDNPIVAQFLNASSKMQNVIFKIVTFKLQKENNLQKRCSVLLMETIATFLEFMLETHISKIFRRMYNV